MCCWSWWVIISRRRRGALQLWTESQLASRDYLTKRAAVSSDNFGLDKSGNHRRTDVEIHSKLHSVQSKLIKSSFALCRNVFSLQLSYSTTVFFMSGNSRSIFLSLSTKKCNVVAWLTTIFGVFNLHSDFHVVASNWWLCSTTARWASCPINFHSRVEHSKSSWILSHAWRRWLDTQQIGINKLFFRRTN